MSVFIIAGSITGVAMESLLLAEKVSRRSRDECGSDAVLICTELVQYLSRIVSF